MTANVHQCIYKVKIMQYLTAHCFVAEPNCDIEDVVQKQSSSSFFFFEIKKIYSFLRNLPTCVPLHMTGKWYQIQV